MRVSALRAGESPAKRVSAKQDGGAGVRQVPYFSDSFQTVSKSLRAIPQINPQTVRELYRTAGNSGNGKVRKTTAISVGYRTVANYGEQCTGGAGGIRTLDTPLERITV